ncbi:MAG: type II secretion system F family protein [Candidatus Micrarchaeota archaeon]
MATKPNKADGLLSRQRTSRRVGAALPKSLRDRFVVLLRFAGIREDARTWLGMRLLIAFLIGSILIALYLIAFNPYTSIGTLSVAIALFLSGLGLTSAVSYLQLYYRISDRTAKMEEILPDFLLLTASNLRSGSSPFAAFYHAARPEFGPFYEEVMLCTAKSGGKTPLPVTLTEVSSYFDSQVLRRSVNLFVKGLRSGGHLARLLTSIAQEVRRIQDLRAELTSSTRAYTVFLMFILVVVMPFLLSISSHFVAVFIKINSESIASDDAVSGLPIFMGKLSITVADMQAIAIASILLSSFFVSMLIGIIAKGKAAYGIKYFPVLVIAASLMYLLAKAFIEGFLSGFAI